MGGHQVMWVEPRDGVRHPTELPPPPAAGDGQWGTQSVHQEETPQTQNPPAPGWEGPRLGLHCVCTVPVPAAPADQAQVRGS